MVRDGESRGWGGVSCYILLNPRDWLLDELRKANKAVSTPTYQSSGQLLKLVPPCGMGKKQREKIKAFFTIELEKTPGSMAVT